MSTQTPNPSSTAGKSRSMPLPPLRRVIAADAPAARGVIAGLLAQLDAVRRGASSRIVIPAGRHEVRPHELPQRLCYVSNNDSGLRPVLFDLTGLNGVEIDGQGAELVFHGEIIPVMANRCRDLRIANITIDWARPFLSQGLVVDADAGRIRLDMHPDHPFEVHDGRVTFTGTDYRSSYLHNMLAFDAERREPAFRAVDHYGLMPKLRAASAGSTRLDLFGEFAKPPAPGEVMVIKHHGRTAPGMCFDRCRGVEVEDVAIHHAGGMAFVGQATRDIALRRCTVAPPADSDRVFSAHADATHFTDCHGRIELADCTFANQLDDATNIHGIYRRVDGSGSTTRLHARLVHDQQDGVETLAAGDTVALFDDRDFAEIGRAEVTAVTNPDSASAVYDLSHRVDLVDGHTVAMRWDHDVDVHISGCRAHGNRARGFLISTLGRVVIERNHLHVPGSAIQFNFDGGSWYESGPVEDVTIRDNHFDNCLHGVWGKALFSVDPHIAPEHRRHAVNRNITIANNRIDASDPRMIFAHSVSGLRFVDNDITWTDVYPRDRSDAHLTFEEAVGVLDCQPITPPREPADQSSQPSRL
ncbi:MAG: right-handed parallel beta-helix repeat-containing protein [Planctomycetota bacterium]